MKERTIDLERTVVAHHQVPEVPQPCFGALNDPATLIASQGSSVLCGRSNTILLVRADQLDPEKFDQFSALYGSKLGMRVIRCSGDYTDQVSDFLRGKYDLALLTYEMFLQLVVGSPYTLGQLGLIVIDEVQFHYRSDSGN